MHPLMEILMPEAVLILGATLVLLAGLSRAASGRAALLALLTIAVALWLAGRLVDAPIEAAGVTSLHQGPLVWYARLITLSIGALIVLVNRHVPDEAERGEYFSLILFSLAGISLVAVANHLVLFFLALELVSVPTYILIGLSRRDIRAQEAAGKYFFLGAFAAAIMLYGFSFLYGYAGTMTMFGSTGSISASLSAPGALHDPLILVGLLLSLAGMAFKIAAFPLHFYVADVYQGAASPVTGLLGFVPKFAGFLALIQLLTLTGWRFGDEIYWLLWAMAAVTMTVGNTLALMQHNVKRMLAYSGVAHSGYMLVAIVAGPALASPERGPLRDGLAALLFYMTVYGIMNLGCFTALSYFRKPGVDDPDESAETTDDLAGIARKHPWAALALSLCVLGLMGFPLTGGFIGKLYIISAALSAGGEVVSGASAARQTGMYVLVVLLALNAAVAAAYYLRILASCYLRKATAALTPMRCHALQFSLAVCALIAIALFVRPGLLFGESKRAVGEVSKLSRRTAVVATNELGEPPELNPIPPAADF
ncbi:MAG: NADH-quinone oxidoreductase subunit N [Phycisphaerae bacterium]|nr:NADH-quinone oxidoreductase subunit N [Phycisphaerae bacterium]